MVIHKRLDYGSSGYQVPPMPHVPRSAKGKRSARKKIEVNPLSAFDLLATVAGKLLEAENTSPLPDHTTTEKDTSRQETMDKGKSPEVEVFDRRSCNRSMLVPEGSVHRQGNYSTNDHPQTSNTVSGHSSMFIKSDKPDKDVFAGNSMVTDTRVELGYCLGMIPEKCSLACEAGKGASIAAPMESPAAGSTAVGVDGGGSSGQSEEGLMKLEELNCPFSSVAHFL